MEEEIWYPVIKFGKNQHGTITLMTYFSVSNYGNVKGHLFKGKKWEDDFVTIKNGRRAIKSGLHGNMVYQLVDRLFRGPLPEGYDVHHIDGNKLNDRLDNLERVTNSWHAAHHMEEYWSNEENHIKRSEQTKQTWSDKDKRDEIISKIKESQTEEVRQKKSVASKNNWKNSDYREKCIKNLNPANTSGKHWYNNGVKRKMFYTEEEAFAEGYKNKGKKL